MHVNVSNVRGESIQDPTRRMAVEEKHLGADDAPKELIVQGYRCPQAHLEEGKGPGQCQYEHG